MSEDLPIIDGDTPLKPVQLGSLRSQYLALADECKAVIAFHKGRLSEVTFQMNWNLGLALSTFIEQQAEPPSLLTIWEELVVYGGAGGYSYNHFWNCLHVVEAYHGKEPEGLTWTKAKELLPQPEEEASFSPEKMPMPTKQDTQPKPKKEDVHALVLDRVGKVWARGDMQTVAHYLGYSPVDVGTESVSPGALEGV